MSKATTKVSPQDERIKQRAERAVRSALTQLDRDQLELVKVWNARAEVLESIVASDPRGTRNAEHTSAVTEIRKCMGELLRDSERRRFTYLG